METERLRALGQAAVGFLERGEGWEAMSQVLAADLGSSDAFWSNLVGVCQEKQVRMEGPRAEEIQEQQVTCLCFAMLGLLCRKEQSVALLREGREMCMRGFFLSSSAK